MPSSNPEQANPGQPKEEEEDVAAKMPPSSPGGREHTWKGEDSGLDDFSSA